jgi:hypothetical protein
MAKIKLPRKRKKAYIKAKSRSDYKTLRVVIEILFEEDVKNTNKFYHYRDVRTPKERKRPDYKNGYVIEKKW